jgi:hypothetical protein
VIAPDSLVVDGAAIPLAGVLAELTIRHGRADVFDSPTAASFQATLLDRSHAFVKAFRTGASLVFNARDGAGAPFPRFTGRVTDATLEVDDLAITAIGPYASLATRRVGAVDYPQEAWSARIARIFADAGVNPGAYVLEPDPDFDPVVAARPHDVGDLPTLPEVLEDAAATVGCAIADLPDGRTLVQALGSRVYANQFPLDPAQVEYAPAWTLALPGANIVTVAYAAGGSITKQETPSVALYGPRSETLTTAIVDANLAGIRCTERLARAAYPHWQVPSAPSLIPLDLRIGRQLILSSTPAAAPFDPWFPVLEGWTDVISADADGLDWRMELNLSDPLLSGVTIPWNAVPLTAAYHWNTINQAVAWKDALTLDSLAP